MTPINRTLPSPTKRFEFLDAARGGAMFFVLLSHFAGLALRSPDQRSLCVVLISIGMIATPSFVILSGALLGVLYEQNRSAFSRIRTKLIDRGLFLLIVGHLLITLALFPSEHTWTWSFSTDAIAAAMVIGAIAIPRVGRSRRLAASVIMYAYSWLAIYWIAPHNSQQEALKELLVGSLTPAVFTGGSFPFLPWIAVYLASTVLGERLAMLLRQDARSRAAAELALIGGAAMATMAVIKVAAMGLGIAPLRHAGLILLRVHKYPPSPPYLLFFGGIGLLLLAAWLVIETRGWCGRSLRTAAVCGQASFFIFVAHFYIYWFGVREIAPTSVWAAAICFVLFTGLLLLLAREWYRGRYNRLLTIGIEPLWRVTSSRRPVITTEIFTS